jgi:hypothetical protein
MVQLQDKDTGALLGQITDEQLQFLKDQLEEESSRDQDYYISIDTLEMLRAAGADPSLIDVLGRALGGQEGREVRWVPSS